MDELFQNGCGSVKFIISHVIVPTDGWDSVFRLEHVGDWRVIQDYNVIHVSSEASQILNESVVVVGTVFTEQMVGTEAFWVKLGTQRLGILGQRGCEHNQFVVFTHSLQEL